MKITILDGFTSNPGDLSWEAFETLGSVTVYDRVAHSDIVRLAHDADAVLTNKVVLSAEMLRSLPNLKYIGILATGTNVVDLDEAHRLGIVVTNIPAYSTPSVAQMVFALLLAIADHVESYTGLNREGFWSKCDDFCYQRDKIIELADKQMGIVGFGNIGAKVAEIASAFGMRVVAFTSKPKDKLPEYVAPVTLDNLLVTSDVVSLHCPLTPDTHHLINAERLAMMKRTSILINTARGPLVDEQALANALADGTIYAAGLDVMEQEPPRDDNPLFAVPNCMITPHVGWASFESRKRLIQIAYDNLVAFIAGKPINEV